MAFGLAKSRGRQLPELSGDWVGWLDPGVEVEGKMKVASGLIRVIPTSRARSPPRAPWLSTTREKWMATSTPES